LEIVTSVLQALVPSPAPKKDKGKSKKKKTDVVAKREVREGYPFMWIPMI
jgi:hypothetical protein